MTEKRFGDILSDEITSTNQFWGARMGFEIAEKDNATTLLNANLEARRGAHTAIYFGGN